jgi:glutamate-1-semialdehyde 2,1-aminomutase
MSTSEARSTSRSAELFQRARELIPGGVNSPVRAFRGVGGEPLFIESGKGPFLFDADGNRYIDYVLSWGPLVLGHADARVAEAIARQAEKGTSFGAPTRLENELAELVISLYPAIEMIRFVSSGTEATMSALRLARAVTGREKIIKMAGCYHGHADMLLSAAGSGVATLGLPDSPGVPAGAAAMTLTAEYNDLAAVERLFEANKGQIAAVITEPIAANMGFVMPERGYLQGLQALCRAERAMFVLDEVMTGFRVSPGGAQAAWGLEPDITCLGKVIGGGLPVGAYAGRREVMRHVAPAGPMYQAGTLSGNPLAMIAGLTTIRALLEGETFGVTASRAAQLAEGLSAVAGRHGIAMQTGHAGSMFGFYFLKERGQRITSYREAKAFAHTERYARFFHAMLERGVYFACSQFEAGFVSAAHTPAEIEATLRAADEVMRVL